MGYPAMRDSAENVAAAGRLGYDCVDQFVLTAADWTEYYGPLARNVARLREEYASRPAALEALDAITREIDVYEECGGEYGYVFYVLQAAKAARPGCRGTRSTCGPVESAAPVVRSPVPPSATA
jgi:hypothetical protein